MTTKALLTDDPLGLPNIINDGCIVVALGRPLRPGETCVSLVESARADGYVVTRLPRSESPTGLSWPGIVPAPPRPRVETAWSKTPCTCPSTLPGRHYWHCAKWRAVTDPAW